jgi:hypothetical protein
MPHLSKDLMTVSSVKTITLIHSSAKNPYLSPMTIPSRAGCCCPAAGSCRKEGVGLYIYCRNRESFSHRNFGAGMIGIGKLCYVFFVILSLKLVE